jgi:hypothetical protein
MDWRIGAGSKAEKTEQLDFGKMVHTFHPTQTRRHSFLDKAGPDESIKMCVISKLWLQGNHTRVACPKPTTQP